MVAFGLSRYDESGETLFRLPSSTRHEARSRLKNALKHCVDELGWKWKEIREKPKEQRRPFTQEGTVKTDTSTRKRINNWFTH